MALFEKKEEKTGYDYRIQDVRDYIKIAEYCNKNFSSRINWQILENGNLLITQTDKKSTGFSLSFNCLNELNKIRIIQVVSAKDSLTYEIFFDKDSVSKRIAEYNDGLTIPNAILNLQYKKINQ